MIHICDLHTHSTASDGQYSPSELVEKAKAKGIEVLALTDHDSADGLEEAVSAGKSRGVRVIRGIEFSAREYPTFHILGYGFDPATPRMASLCAEMKERRDARKYRIIEFLKKKGMDIPIEEVDALAGGVCGRPHFAQLMLRHGYISNLREAFDLYLDTPEFHAHVERKKPEARTCVETIKAAGGKVSLAHPYQIGISDPELDALVREMAGWGLDAIECYYPRFSPEQQAYYLFLAEKYGLRVTGGSDFHGERVKPDIQLATLELDADWL
ncbi:MAG: PHP domain-containing protein [Oscillospiraceae bacterium]|nr:PHP domain-containing protein [Oscillospiraceae bacterium]